MKVLVAGATGVLGKEIVRRLCDNGHDVTALVRSTSAPEKVAYLRQLGVSLEQGDLKDPASLVSACRGVDAVISTVSMVLTAQPGDSFAATDSAGTRNLIDAAAAAHARHFVFVSFDSSVVPDCPLVIAKREAEDHLTRSGLTYSILQPSLFMESWLGPMLFADPNAGTAKIYGNGHVKMRYVAVANVAELAVQCLTVPSARHAIIPFGGPEELSQRDALRLFEEAYEKSFTVTELPEQALEAAWRSADDPMQKSFSALMLSVARGLDAGMQPPFESFPMQMVSVADFVRANAAAHRNGD
ncbi:MAG: SDR family oxidoreductase [Gemmatimonadaceae bacterium]